MIPKIIHYCWFGGNPLPDEYKGYIETWKKFCPDYEIREWNESNFDVNQNTYCKEAYAAKKWAFVSDYARLKIIFENGGIYLDTDVEVLKDLSPLISDDIGFIGFQNQEEANTGLGFAAAPNNICIGKMLELYEKRHFNIGNEEYDLTPCPVVNTVALRMCGLKTGKINALRIQELSGLKVYPIEFFNPVDPDTMKCTITENTYTIHRYSASWTSSESKKMRKLKKFIPACILHKRTEYISKRDVKAYENKLNGRVNIN